MSGLRLAFMGTPDFAVLSLAALAEAGHEIAAVIRNRCGRRPRAERAAVAGSYLGDGEWTAGANAEVLRDAAEQAAFAALALDAAVVAAYGLILPKPILDAPRLGCINVHASLLPRWRGAAPIQRAVLAGDRETGISIMLMEEGLDTGPILAMESISIDAATSAGALHDALAALGGKMICLALDGFAADKIDPVDQDDAAATYAKKIERRKPASIGRRRRQLSRAK